MLLLGFAFGVLSTNCGSTNPDTGTTGFFLTISKLQYSPLDLHAPPGATITVINSDSMSHSVTSEAAAGAFSPGAPEGATAFDTGAFTGTTTFSLASTAVNGTVIPYYCSVHKATMSPPTGTITVDTSAQPGPAPATSYTPGY